MERYLAIDSGKFCTKVAEYDIEKDAVKTQFAMRTKVGDGDFRDDAIESKTVVVQIGDKVYKVGNGARGKEASLTTDKKTEVHKICVLTALATIASSKEKDEFNVAIGLPAKEWANVSTRCDFKDYMLPEGDITVAIKTSSSAPVIEKTFSIKNRFVYPESIGALFMDDSPQIGPNTITGVIDIGNLNLNATLWQGTDLIGDKSLTADLGGAILIQELAQELSSNITPTDELIAANILKGEKKFPSGLNLTEEQIEESAEIVSRVLHTHADKVKRSCHARNWSLDVTRIVAIGGTSEDIAEELKEAFGNITILEESTYCNVLGFLRIMCGTLLDKKINIKRS